MVIAVRCKRLPTCGANIRVNCFLVNGLRRSVPPGDAAGSRAEDPSFLARSLDKDFSTAAANIMVGPSRTLHDRTTTGQTMVPAERIHLILGQPD